MQAYLREFLFLVCKFNFHPILSKIDTKANNVADHLSRNFSEIDAKICSLKMAYLFRLNARSLRLSMRLLLTGKNFLFRMTFTRFFNLHAGPNATFSLLEPGGTLSPIFASLFCSVATSTELLSRLPEKRLSHSLNFSL